MQPYNVCLWNSCLKSSYFALPYLSFIKEYQTLGKIIFSWEFTANFFIRKRKLALWLMKCMLNWIGWDGCHHYCGCISWASCYKCLSDVNGLKDLIFFFFWLIQAPRTSKGSALKSSGRSFGNGSPANHWHCIVESLEALLSTLKENFVWSFLLG